jgi:hypothetical protein
LITSRSISSWRSDFSAAGEALMRLTCGRIGRSYFAAGAAGGDFDASARS